MRFHFFIYCLLLTVYCSSCSSNNSGSAGKNGIDSLKIAAPSFDTSLEKGKVIPEIKCIKESSLSYALYLPKNYSSDKKFPVIYFFDSHGSGSLPLEKYKDLAEKYGYILAGSNNSKNGMSWEQNHPQIQTFMSDVKERLNIDSRRIYTCGFSGGSRVASSVAIFDGGVSCAIGMGAGFPSLSEPIHNKFDYIGFAGNEDFNMNEMIALTSSMDKTPIRHQLIIFNGKHEWVPAEIAEDAFVWIELNAMKDGLTSKNDSLIKHITVKSESELKNLEQKKRKYEEVLLCKQMSNFLDGLANVSEFQKKAELLSASEDLKKEMIQKDMLAKQELSQQENYRNYFVMKDLSWWMNEIKKLNQFSKNKSDEEKSVMYKRLLNYLSLLAYMNASSALQSNQLDITEKSLKIYEQVDPENSEHQYLFADFYARKKNNAKAISSLENAVKLGFDDVARMESDASLSVLKNDPEYRHLVEKLKGKN
jgi:dienelactone hydrolase